MPKATVAASKAPSSNGSASASATRNSAGLQRRAALSPPGAAPDRRRGRVGHEDRGGAPAPRRLAPRARPHPLGEAPARRRAGGGGGGGELQREIAGAAADVGRRVAGRQVGRGRGGPPPAP